MTQVIGAAFVTIAFVVPDHFLTALMFHACTSCEILQKEVKNFLEKDDVAKLDYQQSRIKLKEIVESHLRLAK